MLIRSTFLNYQFNFNALVMYLAQLCCGKRMCSIGFKSLTKILRLYIIIFNTINVYFCPHFKPPFLHLIASYSWRAFIWNHLLSTYNTPFKIFISKCGSADHLIAALPCGGIHPPGRGARVLLPEEVNVAPDQNSPRLVLTVPKVVPRRLHLR